MLNKVPQAMLPRRMCYWGRELVLAVGCLFALGGL